MKEVQQGDFLDADKHKSFLQIDTMIIDGDEQAFPKFPKQKVCNVFIISCKRSQRNEIDFLHADKHQNFLQVDFNALIIKVSLIVIPLLSIGMSKDSQITQSNKLAISLQYLEKEVMEGVYFFACR